MSDSIELRSTNESVTPTEQLRLDEENSTFKDELLNNPKGIWLMISGFFSTFIVFGIGFSYGVFQEFYTSPSGPLHNYSDAKAALIGTAGTALTYICTLSNKPLLYHFKPRYIMMSGTALMTLGLCTATVCNDIVGFIFTQGVIFGIGASLVYSIPAIIVPFYFKKLRSLAFGVIFSGTGFGGFAMAYITRGLLNNLDWRWAVRILGLINFVIGICCSLMVTAPSSKGFRTDTRIFNISQVGASKVFLTLMGAGLYSAAYLIPGFFMSKYGITLGYSDSTGALFIGINNLINAVFKIIFGYLAVELGNLNTCILTNSLVFITVFALWLIGTKPTFIAFVVFYGVFSGVQTSVLPTAIVELFGVQNYQAMIGLMYVARGCGTMIGSPVAGQLISGKGLVPSDYTDLIVYCGMLVVGSSIALGVLRGMYRDKNWKI